MEARESQEPAVDPGRTEREKKRAERAARSQRRLKILFPFLLVCVFFVYSFTTNYIPSRSMEPTLMPGDHILTMREWLAYPRGRMPARGDIIIFKIPRAVVDGQGEPDSQPDSNSGPSFGFGQHGIFAIRQKDEDILIKRVVGLPGESVQVQGNDVYINGRKLEQDYRTQPLDPENDGGFPYASYQPLQLGPDELFVLGDNRNNSDDGRFWGALKRDSVIGKYVCVIFRESANGPNQKKARREGDTSGQ